jgi:hypothetical protein
MSSSSSTAKENMQMSHQAVVQPALDLREPEPPAMTFQCKRQRKPSVPGVDLVVK